MIGVIGEDTSDAGTLKCLIKRLLNNESASIKQKGCDSKGELLRKGARIISTMMDLGCTHFIICADADSHDPNPILKRLKDEVIAPSGLTEQVCCVVAVQEIEAWILADIHAVTKVITSWVPEKTVSQPETINSSKEYLISLSRGSNKKPRYDHVTHNPQVAKHINIDLVYGLCPSFRTLADFVWSLKKRKRRRRK